MEDVHMDVFFHVRVTGSHVYIQMTDKNQAASPISELYIYIRRH